MNVKKLIIFMDFYNVIYARKIIVNNVLFYVLNVNIYFVKNVEFAKNVIKIFVLIAEKIHRIKYVKIVYEKMTFIKLIKQGF